MNVRLNETEEEELLNRIAAIQAAAEILDDTAELSHGDRHTFLTAIQTEVARLHALVRRVTYPECL
jgi:hypothetical protein